MTCEINCAFDILLVKWFYADDVLCMQMQMATRYLARLFLDRLRIAVAKENIRKQKEKTRRNSEALSENFEIWECVRAGKWRMEPGTSNGVLHAPAQVWRHD